MRRRDFVIGIAGSAVAAPVAGHAQQNDPVRHIGVLMNFAADDPESTSRLAAFREVLQALGWTDGRNARVDVRWAAAAADRFRQYAAELIALAPDVTLAATAPALEALQRASRNVPIVFVNVVDPVGAGYLPNLAHPGGNVTGFLQFEYGVAGKWLELLKEIAPRITRVAILWNPALASGRGQLEVLQAAAARFHVEVSPVDSREAEGINQAVSAFARGPNGGLIVISSSSQAVHRDLIIALAARHHLPAIYPLPYYVSNGGLIAYGPDALDGYRRAAGYVDRILKGEKPGDLPVQAPTKYELVVNVKTAKALDLNLPQSLLARADEVIE